MNQPDTQNQVYTAVTEIEEPPWLAEVSGTALRVLNLLQITNWELSVLLCNDSYMQGLNRTYRQKDKPTDILSFSQFEDGQTPFARDPEERIIAGDIIISLDSLKKNALQNQVPLQTELKRLIIHGILHLTGRDHTATDDGMLILQEKLLNNILEEKF